MSLERISCPSCGGNSFRQDAEGRLVCNHCGANFGSPQEEVTCPACGVENPAQALKCMSCGLTLGKICPACNHPNPPSADHCLQCATPLDTLTSVMMRSEQGKQQTAASLKKQLVQAKGKDMVWMQEQRAKLHAEEAARQQELHALAQMAHRQQQTMMLIATIVGGLLICGLVALALLSR